MITFINEFLTYGLLVIIMGALAVAGVFVGKTLRKKKDEKDALQAGSGEVQ